MIAYLGRLSAAHEVVDHVYSAVDIGEFDESLISIRPYIELCLYKPSEWPGEVF
jgi:hypothetical protein